jgi:hypothetical protein
MNQFKNQIVAVVTLAGLVFTSACQNDSGAEPLPSATNSSTTAAATPRPIPTRAPDWESRYTPRQLRAYEAALRRFQEYETRSEPIWAAGKANAQTERFFKMYFLDWFNQQRLLTTYEDNEIRLFGLGRTVSSRPTRVAISDEGESVTIKQCVDFNTTRTTQHGKETEKFTRKPQVRAIVLSRYNRPEAPWIITHLKTSLGKRPCSAA